MIGTPRLEERTAQAYVGIRTQVPITAFKDTIPQLLGEVFGWLQAQNIAPAGPPFMRYYVINMPGLMDIELGVPVRTVLSSHGRVTGGTLPAGRYATLIYTGVHNGIAGNKALLEWGAANGLVWDQWEVENGDAFGSRLEFYLTNPDQEPDPAQWQTEVAIRLAEKPA